MSATAGPGRPVRRVLVAVDAGGPDVAAGEHLVHLLDDVLPSGGPSYLASTHVVDGHVAVAASWEPVAVDPAERPSSSAAAAVAAVVAAVVGAVPPPVGVLVQVEDAEDAAGPPGLVAGATAAAREHAVRGSGRVARFPGRRRVERRTTVGEVVAASDIDAVEGLAGVAVTDASLVDLTGWARPTWSAGRTVLLVQPGRGALVPFEAQRQIPCCADH